MKYNIFLEIIACDPSTYTKDYPHLTVSNFMGKFHWYTAGKAQTLDGQYTDHMSQCMKFPTIWNVRPAKAQTSLRIRAV